jgi:hypothetical protein
MRIDYRVNKSSENTTKIDFPDAARIIVEGQGYGGGGYGGGKAGRSGRDRFVEAQTAVIPALCPRKLLILDPVRDDR